MAAAADITVKKYDGTTDIVWTLVAASGGDKSPAVWRSNTAPGTVGQRPWFQMAARPNQQGTVRRLDVSASFPSVFTNSTTGQTEVRATMNFTGSFAVPQNIVDTDIREFAYQVANLVASTMTKVSAQSGFAPV
jgi:hypothetical protein